MFFEPLFVSGVLFYIIPFLSGKARGLLHRGDV